MTHIAAVGRVLPGAVVYQVADGAVFSGAPGDWITVAEYQEMRDAGRTKNVACAGRCVDCQDGEREVYDNEEVHPIY